MNPSLVILAAGLGSRYGSLKQIDQFGPSGETIIDYAIYDAIKAGFKKVVFVIRRKISDEFKEVFVDKFSDRIAIDYALQETEILPPGIAPPPGRLKPWGTGHAVLVAENKITEPFAVINADDFYGSTSFKLVFDFLTAAPAAPHVCMVGFDLLNTLSENGAVSRAICEVDHDQLLSLMERPRVFCDAAEVFFADEAGSAQPLDANAIVSMNLWGFTPDIFGHLQHRFRNFLENNRENENAEFFLPAAIDELIKSSAVKSTVLRSREKWFGVTYQKDKAVAKQRLRDLVAAGHYPENLWRK